MKKLLTASLLLATALGSARATTPLTVGEVTLVIPGGPCWDDSLLLPAPLTASNTFSLTGVTGAGVVKSGASYKADNVHGTQHVFYTYSLDLSGMTLSPNHCVKLLIHFGPTLDCNYDVLVLTNGTGSVNVSSATLAPYGDINLLFGSGCLLPGQTATTFGMLNDTQPKYGSITIIDDYTNPGNGQTNETRVNVGAVVPDIPPDWAYAPPLIPNPFFQGSLVTNPYPYYPPTNGIYHFLVQLSDSSNGLPASLAITQAVPVINGLFNMPLPFDPVAFSATPAWLNLSIQPPGSSNFIALNSPLPITPAPQAIYAFTAGVVADLSPGQAVTSLNGLTDAVIIQAGSGILLGTNGNTLTLAAQPGVGSDRNLKTAFAEVKPEDLLTRLVALPIQSWRYTNESAEVRHVGPMAQDFKAAFGLGTDDKFIAFVDEQGVALAAIQGLNRKLEIREAELQILKKQNDSLAQRLDELETKLKALSLTK